MSQTSSREVPEHGCCHCLERCKPRSEFYREITPLLEHPDTGLTNYQRKVVKRSYVNFVSRVDTMSIQSKKRADWTWDIIEYGNLLLAFLAVARDLPFVTENTDAFHVVVGIIYFCSLIVNMAVQIIKRKKYVEKYVLYNKVATTLKSLGYNFLSATGKYKSFLTPPDAYRSFIHDIQMLRVMVATSENILFGRDEEADMRQKDPEAFEIMNKIKDKVFDKERGYSEDKTANQQVTLRMRSSIAEEDAKSEISSTIRDQTRRVEMRPDEIPTNEPTSPGSMPPPSLTHALFGAHETRVPITGQGIRPGNVAASKRGIVAGSVATETRGLTREIDNGAQYVVNGISKDIKGATASISDLSGAIQRVGQDAIHETSGAIKGVGETTQRVGAEMKETVQDLGEATVTVEIPKQDLLNTKQQDEESREASQESK